jgi:hypothetical protein
VRVHQEGAEHNSCRTMPTRIERIRMWWSSMANDSKKAQAVLSEPELLQAMFDVGYFPPNTPPAE